MFLKKKTKAEVVFSIGDIRVASLIEFKEATRQIDKTSIISQANQQIEKELGINAETLSSDVSVFYV